MSSPAIEPCCVAPVVFRLTSRAQRRRVTCRILRADIRGWFCIDFVTIAVSGLDLIALDASSDNVDENSSNVSRLKILRVLRTLRLMKLMRLVRASRLAKRWETRAAINYANLELLKVTVGVILLGHSFACVWGLQTTFEHPKDTWYTEYGYCTFVPRNASCCATPNVAANSCCNREDESAYVCLGPMPRYVASLYFAIMTITSIGYGDIAPAQGNSFEQIVCTMLMLMGATAWGMVIATLCGMIAHASMPMREFRLNMDRLNKFMVEKRMPMEMQRRLREYFHQTRHLQVVHSHNKLIDMMSPMLQGEVVWFINERWLRRVSFLRRAEKAFMVQLSLSLHAAVFAPTELAPKAHLYIIHAGLALYGGRVLRSGMVWGEDMILESEHLRSRVSCPSLQRPPPPPPAAAAAAAAVARSGPFRAFAQTTASLLTER